MPASRRADDADAFGVVAVLLGIGSQPADRSLAVVNLSGTDGFLCGRTRSY